MIIECCANHPSTHYLTQPMVGYYMFKPWCVIKLATLSKGASNLEVEWKSVPRLVEEKGKNNKAITTTICWYTKRGLDPLKYGCKIMGWCGGSGHRVKSNVVTCCCHINYVSIQVWNITHLITVNITVISQPSSVTYSGSSGEFYAFMTQI